MSTRILWSGLTGRTGCEAVKQLKNVSDVEIVAGISRRDYNGKGLKIDVMRSSADGLDLEKTYDFRQVKKWYLYDNIANQLKEQPSDFDVLVDFSHRDVFERVVELAVRTHVPLISGTSGLSDRQMALLYDAANQIPIFRGGNFRFKVKKFIDEAVELAKEEEGKESSLYLYENFYAGKSLPSETSKVVQRRISEATGRAVEVCSSATLPGNELICDWKFLVRRPPSSFFTGKVQCRTVGFDELAHDVLEIAKVMAHKPIKKGEFYDLDEIWDELPH